MPQPINEPLIHDYLRFIFHPDASDNLEAYKMIIDSALFISRYTHEAMPATERDVYINDAVILFQLTLTKGIVLNELVAGINFRNQIDGFHRTPLYEPMSMGALIRSQLEAYTNFHNIFLQENKHAKDLLYSSWVISGLKTRQTFVDEESSEEDKQKAADELKTIDYYLNRIANNELYKSFTSEKRNWIDQRIKKKAYEFMFKDDDLTLPGWKELFLNTNVRDIYKHQYAALSQFIHPSNVSVFQFEEMYRKNNSAEMSVSLLNRSKEILAFMITDYCSYLPKAKEAFAKLPEINQILIDAINYNFREAQEPLYAKRDAFYESLTEYARLRH